jgi:hypothetical protein
LYILYDKWLNDRINGFGYSHRGFGLSWRDYDSPWCEPNAGKRWSDPAADPYLASFAGVVPTVTRLCQKLHPGERYYLTNLQASALDPAAVRAWPDDLWLFPYYTDPRVVPHDARKDGPASSAYPVPEAMVPAASAVAARAKSLAPVVLALVAIGLPVVAIMLVARRSGRRASAP